MRQASRRSWRIGQTRPVKVVFISCRNTLQAVRHSVSEYVSGQVHTYGIESFWATLKRGYHGVYHHMSAKHLHRYVREFSGRHNSRPKDTIDQVKTVIRGMEGKRLKLHDLMS